jgi:hypothetical protein
MRAPFGCGERGTQFFEQLKVMEQQANTKRDVIEVEEEFWGGFSEAAGPRDRRKSQVDFEVFEKGLKTCVQRVLDVRAS